MMLLLYFPEGTDGSFIDVWSSMMTIVPRLVDERVPSSVFTDCQ